MGDFNKFSQARITLNGQNITFVADVWISEKIDTIEFPKFLDSDRLEIRPNLRKVSAYIRRKFHSGSPLRALLDGSTGIIAFIVSGESLSFQNAILKSWKLSGEIGGEIIEEAEIEFGG